MALIFEVDGGRIEVPWPNTSPRAEALAKLKEEMAKDFSFPKKGMTRIKAAQRIKAALERANKIGDDIYEGHVVGPSLEGKESSPSLRKDEASIQDIIGLLGLAEAETVRLQRGEGNLPQLVVFLRNAMRKLETLANKERRLND